MYVHVYVYVYIKGNDDGYGPSLAWGGDMVHHWHGEEIWSIIGMGRRGVLLEH